MTETKSVRPLGPPPRFLIGNFPWSSADLLGTLSGWARKFGDIYYFRSGWTHFYVLNHPDLVEAALVNHHKNLSKGPIVKNSRWLIGEGLLTSEGTEWLRKRRLSQPSFHRERVASYGETITKYASEMLASWRDGEKRDVHLQMMQVTLRIVAKVLLDVEVVEETEKIAATLDVLARPASFGLMALPSFLRYLPLPAAMRLRRAARQLDEIVYRIIRSRSEGNLEGKDLLSLLRQARGEDGSALTERQLRDEAWTLLVAGHETTAVALSWTWYLLSQHPAAERKLHVEIDQVLGGRTPNVRDLPKLVFAENVIKEAMRLYPPLWTLARAAESEFELAGHSIPAGSIVVVSQWVIHRDPRFYDLPDEFEPDRWCSEASQNLPKFAYFPFGGGPRLCIGAALAMTEAVLLLVTIAQRFRLEMVANHPVVPVPSITLRPKHGLQMTLRSRN